MITRSQLEVAFNGHSLRLSVVGCPKASMVLCPRSLRPAMNSLSQEEKRKSVPCMPRRWIGSDFMITPSSSRVKGWLEDDGRGLNSRWKELGS